MILKTVTICSMIRVISVFVNRSLDARILLAIHFTNVTFILLHHQVFYCFFTIISAVNLFCLTSVARLERH